MSVRPLHILLCAALAGVCAWNGREAALRAYEARPRDEAEQNWAEWSALPPRERQALLSAFASFRSNSDATARLASAKRLRTLPFAAEQRLLNLNRAIVEFVATQPRSVQSALLRQPAGARAAMLIRLIREAGDDAIAEWRTRFPHD